MFGPLKFVSISIRKASRLLISMTIADRENVIWNFGLGNLSSGFNSWFHCSHQASLTIGNLI